MIKKGKRARITPDGEALIVSRALESPRLQRAVLAEKLQAEFGKRNWPVPKLEVLEKKISKYRNREESPQDKPWSTATLEAYPIPPEALPKVLELWKFRLDTGEKLTIREAKWAARLSAVKLPEGPNLTEMGYDGQEILSGGIEGVRWLSDLTDMYAGAERIDEILDHPFDSEGFDRFIVGLPVKIRIKCDEEHNGIAIAQLDITWGKKEGG